MDTSPSFTETLSILSALAAIGALVYSFLTYKRQQTFENENHFFQYKLDKYNQILIEGHKLIVDLEKKVDTF